MNIENSKKIKPLFFAVRNYLLTKNFVFNQAIKAIHKQRNKSKQFKAILILALELRINEDFIKDYLKNPECSVNQIQHHPDVRIITDKPLMEQGFFLKVEPDLDEKEAIQLIRILKQNYKTPFFSEAKLSFRKQHISPAHVQTYLACQKILPKSVRKKQYDPEEEYGIMDSVFATLASQKIDDERYPEKYQKNYTQIKNNYYNVTEAYKLPTLTQLNSLLRIVNP